MTLFVPWLSSENLFMCVYTTITYTQCLLTWVHLYSNPHKWNIKSLNSSHHHRFQFEYVPMSQCPFIQTSKLTHDKVIRDKILHIRNTNNQISKSNITFITIQNQSAHVHVCSVLLSFVWIFAYAHIYFKTICECIIKPIFIGPRSVAGVPLSQAAPAYLITAHHLCAFLLYLAR